MSQSKLLLVEDDQEIARVIQQKLARSDYDLEWVGDGESGLDLLVSHSYAAAIVDLKLPQLDGLTIIERARALQINTPILVITAKRTVPERVEGLSAGADDYLTKPFSFVELEARIKALIRRAGDIKPPTVLTCADLRVDLVARTVERADGTIELQPLEFELLRCLLENQGHVVSRAMLIQNVWKYNFDPETNIVEVRMSKLRDKVDRERTPTLIQTLRGVGYVIKAPQV